MTRVGTDVYDALGDSPDYIRGLHAKAELDEEYGLIILKAVTVDGEEQLSTLDSDEELELVYQQFMEALFADDEET